MLLTDDLQRGEGKNERDEQGNREREMERAVPALRCRLPPDLAALHQIPSDRARGTQDVDR